MAEKQIDITSTTQEELTSIDGVSDEMAQEILRRQSSSGFVDAAELEENTKIPSDQWKKILALDENVGKEDASSAPKPKLSLKEMYEEFLADRQLHEQQMAALGEGLNKQMAALEIGLKKKMAALDVGVKKSGDRIKDVFGQMLALQKEQDQAQKDSDSKILALHQQVQQSEQQIDKKLEGHTKRLEDLTTSKFNELARRLDKIGVTEEASSIQFKSAVQEQDLFKHMASTVGDLIDKRNKEVKIPMTDTPVRPKSKLGPHQTSTSVTSADAAVGHPAPSLSPISGTGSLQQKASLFSSPSLSRDTVQGTSALPNTYTGIADTATKGKNSLNLHSPLVNIITANSTMAGDQLNLESTTPNLTSVAGVYEDMTGQTFNSGSLKVTELPESTPIPIEEGGDTCSFTEKPKPRLSLKKLYEEFLADREMHYQQMVVLNAALKRSDIRMKNIFGRLSAQERSQTQVKDDAESKIQALHHRVDQSEQRIDGRMEDNTRRLENLTNHKFIELARRLDKISTSGEDTIIQFRKADQQHLLFEDMSVSADELLDRRNSGAGIVETDTSIPVTLKPAEVVYTNPSLSPVPRTGQFTTGRIQSEGSVLSTSLKSEDCVLGPTALLTTAAGTSTNTNGTKLLLDPYLVVTTPSSLVITDSSRNIVHKDSKTDSHQKSTPVAATAVRYSATGSSPIPSTDIQSAGNLQQNASLSPLTSLYEDNVQGPSALPNINADITVVETGTLPVSDTNRLELMAPQSSFSYHGPDPYTDFRNIPSVWSVPVISSFQDVSSAVPIPHAIMTPVMATVSTRTDGFNNHFLSSAEPETSRDPNIPPDRSRKRFRTLTNGNGRSSSGSSIDREYSRWRGNLDIHDRSKSPQLPKMPVFTGRGPLSWEAFIYQFERTAGRRQWEKWKKVCRLLDCLTDVALEYARKLHPGEDYKALRRALKLRFSKKDDPVSARRQLQYAKQKEGESLEEFADRVYCIVMDGYEKCETGIIDQIGAEAFIRGCLDKDSARRVIERNPDSINNALRYMKASIAYKNAIYGPRVHNYAQRQVSFADEPDTLSSRNPDAPPLTQGIGNLSKVVTQLADMIIVSDVKEGLPRRTQSPSTFEMYRPTTPSVSQSSRHSVSNNGSIRNDPGYYKQRPPSDGNKNTHDSTLETDKSLNSRGSRQTANPRSYLMADTAQYVNQKDWGPRLRLK